LDKGGSYPCAWVTEKVDYDYSQGSSVNKAAECVYDFGISVSVSAKDFVILSVFPTHAIQSIGYFVFCNPTVLISSSLSYYRLPLPYAGRRYLNPSTWKARFSTPSLNFINRIKIKQIILSNMVRISHSRSKSNSLYLVRILVIQGEQLHITYTGSSTCNALHSHKLYDISSIDGLYNNLSFSNKFVKRLYVYYLSRI